MGWKGRGRLGPVRPGDHDLRVVDRVHAVSRFGPSSDVCPSAGMEERTVVRDLTTEQGITSVPLPPSLRSSGPPSSPEQKVGVEELDPKAVGERIQRKDIPSTWHVIETAACLPWIIIGLPLLGGMIYSGIVAFMVLGAIIAAVSSGSSLQHTLAMANIQPSGWWTLLLILGTVSLGLQMHVTVDRELVFMPGGFIYFTGKTPNYIISYKRVEDIHFDSTKKSLTVTTKPVAPRSGDSKDDRTKLGGEIDIGRFKEDPSLIVQRIEEAFTSFKARNTLP